LEKRLPEQSKNKLAVEVSAVYRVFNASVEDATLKTAPDHITTANVMSV